MFIKCLNQLKLVYCTKNQEMPEINKYIINYVAIKLTILILSKLIKDSGNK